MKTIEEMANEYADCVACDLPNEHYRDDVKYKAFIAGAQAAQEWKDVKVEQPDDFEEVIVKRQSVVEQGKWNYDICIYAPTFGVFYSLCYFSFPIATESVLWRRIEYK